MVKKGDIVTFIQNEKLYKKQEITVITEVKDEVVYTLGNIKPCHIKNVILICKFENREDV